MLAGAERERERERERELAFLEQFETFLWYFLRDD